MTTVVFIHGTGVREPHLTELCAHIAARLGELAPGVRTVGYPWGEAHGARLAADGASVPAGPGGTARDATGVDDSDTAEGADEVGQWARLYADPHVELALAAAATGQAVTPPGAEFPDERPRRLLAALAAQGDAFAPELGPGLAPAATALARSPLLPPAAAALDPDDLARLLARALAATLIGAAVEADAPVVCGGVERDAAVARLAETLGAEPAGAGRGLVLNLLKRPAMRMGSRMAVRRRKALTDASYPFAGDILRYLSRGAPVRHDLRELIAAQEPPVVLLGHSLGGIIALDTLIESPPGGVELLVTVGSQGPFLYETGALPTLAHPDPLPGHVPPWLNLHDPRDLLAYVGEPLFSGRVTDVATDSRQPFPVSHSAYWSDPAVFRTIVGHLP
ncbi:alpha/beta fold hydrolase [Streptomyces sp. NPDC002851]